MFVCINCRLSTPAKASYDRVPKTSLMVPLSTGSMHWRSASVWLQIHFEARGRDQ